MIEITQYLLGKVVQTNKSNEVARRLLHLITADPNVDLKWFMLFEGKGYNNKSVTPLPIYNFTGHKDFRIKRIGMQGFRKFPYKKNLKYTLNFTGNDCKTPCSCFFIGSNGTGKTSIFSAIQETCSDNFSAAASRGIPKDSFMPHAGTELSAVDVFVNTSSCEIELQNPIISPISSYRKFLRSFFCSEYDIRMMAESKDITDYIISQTGYQKTHRIIEVLETIYNERNQKLSELRNKANEDSLSNVNNKDVSDGEIEMLEYLFDDVVICKILNKNNIDKFDKLIKSLRQEQKINKKQLDKNVEKTMSRLASILSVFEKEKEILQSCNINTEYIIKSYISIISQITLLIEDLAKSKNIESGKIITEFPFSHLKNIPFDIKKRVSLLNLEGKNYSRKCLADIFEDLMYSIKNDQSSLEFTKRYISNIESLKSKNSTTQQNEAISEEKELSLTEANIGQLRQCIDELRDHYNNFIKKAITTTKEICEGILTDFDMNGEVLKISIDGTNNRLRIEYNVDSIPLNPLQLLNSFRFKLYTLCVKISMAFSVMQNMNLSFPLVFDDVFYSSDFVNREKVKDFIEKIFGLYGEKFDAENLPLQMIFFTHDEVVLDAAVKGLNSIEADIKFKYGRIFNYQEMENEKTTNGCCELSIIYGQNN